MRRLPGIPDVIWELSTGFDREGDQISSMIMIAADGSVPAWVDMPMAGEKLYGAVFHAGYVKGFEEKSYIDLAPAMRYCEAYWKKRQEAMRPKKKRKRVKKEA